MKHFLTPCLLLLLLISTITTKAQTPVYSSDTSASAVLFLDFDGHTVAGTAWNFNGPIVCGGSGFDANQITTVFNRVAEDYRPFAINVTTDSTKYLAAPITMRMRIIVTVSSSWYGSAGGVSFVGSFTWGDDTPAFVFSALLNYNTKNISEAISHEAGHSLGLYHQSTYNSSCNKVSDYNYGYGTGEIGWAPIMGVGYDQNLTLWNNGPNSFGCTSYQSDLDIITTYNGFSYREDDFGGTFAGATNMTFVANQFNVSGIIERNTDQDMIKFIQPATGRFQLNAVPYNVGTGNAGSDLDLQITLYNNAQTQLSVFNPGTLLNSVADTTLNAGTYYLKIEGKGNIYAPNYASLGSYSLQGTSTIATVLPLRRLELKGQVITDKHQLSWLIDADEKVIEQILEISTDGRHFTSITNSATTDRSYIYKPFVTSNAIYRLKVTFDDGHYYYSNVVFLNKMGSVVKPELVTNLINNNTVIVKSPGSYNYTIYDFNGKTVRKGVLTNGLNNIDASAISNGVYMVRFANSDSQWIDKFVRQ